MRRKFDEGGYASFNEFWWVQWIAFHTIPCYPFSGMQYAQSLPFQLDTLVHTTLDKAIFSFRIAPFAVRKT